MVNIYYSFLLTLPLASKNLILINCTYKAISVCSLGKYIKFVL